MQDWHLNPISQLENKLDRSIVHRLELQKTRDHINVEVLRKYIISIPERCAAVITATDGHTKYYS